MKNLFILVALTLLIAGCNSNVKQENAELQAALEELAVENAALAAGDVDMELEIEAYRAMLVEIDENLATIDDKHKAIKSQIEGEETTVEGDIKLHLEHIHGTMTNSKHKVAQMQESLDEMYLEEAFDDDVILALEMELDDAVEEIMIRDVVIDELHEAVIEEDIEIDELTVAYEEQAVLSEVLYDALNTAYVTIGTKKELKEYGIMDAEGGFLGMGRVKSIAADADDEWFIPVLIDETDEIDLICKKAKVITSHPESSYSIVGDKELESLVIMNPAAFWDKSDFLIIEIVRE